MKSPQDSLNLLIDGNRRFSSGLRSIESTLSVSKMRELATRGQTPFAIVITCSDSRVPTEMVFDQGLGDLFVIRVAGHVISPTVIASAEYAAQYLGAKLCVVMGHSNCGAVATAVKAHLDRHLALSLTLNLQALITAIQPAVRGGSIPHATVANVRRSVALLSQQSVVLRDAVSRGDLQIVGALYDLESGRVDFNLARLEDVVSA